MTYASYSVVFNSFLTALTFDIKKKTTNEKYPYLIAT